jgi:multisubunit Na+/H+ antiporter MnhC subunit
MSRSDLAWLAVAAYALHILEEHILDWHSFAKKSMNLSMEWGHYSTASITFLILGAVSAMLVPSQPLLALSFAAFLVINAIFFHILPMIMAGGQFSPGVISGVVLFLPIGWAQYNLAPLPSQTVLAAIVIGAAVILTPIVLLWLGKQPYFRPSGGGKKGR